MPPVSNVDYLNPAECFKKALRSIAGLFILGQFLHDKTKLLLHAGVTLLVILVSLVSGIPLSFSKAKIVRCSNKSKIALAFPFCHITTYDIRNRL